MTVSGERLADMPVKYRQFIQEQMRDGVLDDSAMIAGRDDDDDDSTPPSHSLFSITHGSTRTMSPSPNLVSKSIGNPKR